MPCCKGDFYKYKVSDDCGDAPNKDVKANHILSGFKEQTTAHGIPHVHQARGIFKTVFWTLISLGCTAMLFYNLYYITAYFFSYKVDVVVSLNHRRELTFPAVTICNMNPIKESQLHLSSELQDILISSSRRRRSAGFLSEDDVHSRSKREATSYEIEEKAYEIMATLDDTTKRSMGYNLSEFVIDCQYAGSNCHMDEFIDFFDPNYGNCYLFNSGWRDDVDLMTSKRAGRRHGMKFVLNVKQEEYIEALAQGAGARILIHGQSRMPFPSDEGILATPGQITSIGIRQVNIERLDGNYGNCTDQESRNVTKNVYEEVYPVNYTSSACFKTCYQKYVIEACNCADPQYPRQGTAFGSVDTVTEVCTVENAAQSECKDQVSADYQNNDLDCYCPTQCNEVAYNFEVSNVEWPSEVHESVVLDTYADKFPDIVSANDTSSKLRKNVMKVEVYFQEFNYEQMKERPAYLPASYASDIGGILGLWLGLSVLSIFEFFELLSDLCMFCCCKCRRRFGGETKLTDLTKNKNKPNSPPPPYSSNEALSNNNRNTLSHGLQDNVRADGSLRYV